VRVPHAAEAVWAHLVMRGVQLRYVAKLLGHKSIRVTELHYGHWSKITSRKPFAHPYRHSRRII
jgi:integrase